jgi:hypothetical protein
MLAQRYQKKMLKCNKNNYKSTKRLFADDSIIYKEITCQDDCKKLQSLRLDCSVTPRYFAEVTGSRM